MGRTYHILLAVFLGLAILQQLLAKPSVPDWVKEAQQLESPKIKPKDFHPYVLLWDEGIYKVSPSGKIERTIRVAYRLLDNAGSKHAKAYAPYDTSYSTKPKIKAWTIKANGDIHQYKRSDVQDNASSSFHLVNQRRMLFVDGSRRTFKGDVFAYEYTQEEDTIFTQYYWRFEAIRPVALSRITIEAPDDWSVDATPFFDAPKSQRDGELYVWEMRDMSAIKVEDDAPSSSVQHSHIRINITPPSGSRLSSRNLVFNTWGDLADFTADTMRGPSKPDEDIISKTEELISGYDTKWEKIQAIGSFVQKLRYASISLDIGNGGGYTPRPAAETYRVGYGDCKDKSILMVSMLKTAGIDAYAVIVNATDNDSVVPDWPSPHYFNHCILVVSLEEPIEAPAYLHDPDLGHLVFIDPTSEVTPMGELPRKEQGGLVIIGKNGLDKLVRLPSARPSDNSEHYQIEAEFIGNGALIGRLTKSLLGFEADRERYSQKRNSDTKYKTAQARALSDNNSSANIKITAIEDNALQDRTFKITVDFGIRGYGSFNRQISANGELPGQISFIFKPALFSRLAENPYTKKIREHPLSLRAKQISESSKVYLPIGYIVDEYEKEISIETDFGAYIATSSIEGDTLTYNKTFTLFEQIVPPDRYPELQEFYRKVIERDHTPILLKQAPTPEETPTDATASNERLAISDFSS